MSDSRVFDVDGFTTQYQQEQQDGAGGGGKKYKPRDPRLFGLAPFKEKERADNWLYIDLFAPAYFKLFRGVADPNYWVWFTHLKVHRLKDVFDPATGLYDTQQVICSKEMNILTQYQDKKIMRPIIFLPTNCPKCNAKDQCLTSCMTCGERLPDRKVETRCPSCEEAERHWGHYNKEWEKVLPQYGLPPTKASRYQLKNNEVIYKQLTADGTPIGSAQRAATEAMPSDKYYMCVMDYAKLIGTRPVREKEDPTASLQGFLAGHKIYQALASMVLVKVQFWDVGNPQIIVVSKDTARGVRYAELGVVNSPAQVPFTPEMRAYLTNPQVAPDFLDFAAHVLPYNEHAERAKLNLATEAVQPNFGSAVPAASHPGMTVPPAPPMAGNMMMPPAPPAPMGMQPPMMTQAPMAPPVPPTPQQQFAPTPVASPSMVMPPQPPMMAPPPAPPSMQPPLAGRAPFAAPGLAPPPLAGRTAMAPPQSAPLPPQVPTAPGFAPPPPPPPAAAPGMPVATGDLPPVSTEERKRTLF